MTDTIDIVDASHVLLHSDLCDDDVSCRGVCFLPDPALPLALALAPATVQSRLSCDFPEPSVPVPSLFPHLILPWAAYSSVSRYIPTTRLRDLACREESGPAVRPVRHHRFCTIIFFLEEGRASASSGVFFFISLFSSPLPGGGHLKPRCLPTCPSASRC